MSPTLWLGLGGCPTKTAFRPHLAGKLGAKTGQDRRQGQARIWFKLRVKQAGKITMMVF